MSRELLDSINEIYFLDRVCGLLSRKRIKVVDIGAGYGRLAHRMTETVPGLERYFCLDAVAESTFLSKYYLSHRGTTAKTVVVALDEVREALGDAAPDLAVNVHSFSEMPRSSLWAWVRWLATMRVKYLFIVPNDGDELLSMEADGSRRDSVPAVLKAGYSLVHREPMIGDSWIRRNVAIGDSYLLFELTR